MRVQEERGATSSVAFPHKPIEAKLQKLLLRHGDRAFHSSVG
ncbi:hypothetical protein BREVNS_2092 [Brevinematales bacterium NS]|nr:hypothetical protein BREVNS_2092 [Brevinematales bacterium NS]